jgi:hypothetical protein
MGILFSMVAMLSDCRGPVLKVFHNNVSPLGKAITMTIAKRLSAFCIVSYPEHWEPLYGPPLAALLRHP